MDYEPSVPRSDSLAAQGSIETVLRISITGVVTHIDWPPDRWRAFPPGADH